MTTPKPTKAADLKVGPTAYWINGTAQTVTEITPGPVWLNDEHTHLVCPTGWLLITTSDGSKIPATPNTNFYPA